jgi:hypothetical protein
VRCLVIEDSVKVDMIRRTCGGWLAVAAPGSMFLIGVTGPTEEETKERFVYSYRRWQEIYESRGGVERMPGDFSPTRSESPGAQDRIAGVAPCPRDTLSLTNGER